MLGFAIFGVMLLAVSSQDIIGVNYSFDIDFERTFNNKTCSTDAKWKLTNYSTLNIASKPHGSSKGIKSEKESCTSSFSIVFFNNSILEVNIFLEVFAEDSGLNTTIFDKHSIPLCTFSYNRSTASFIPGWSTLSIPINTNVTGYINLIGRSNDNEIVLVDSFRYITSTNTNGRQFNDIFLDDLSIDGSHNEILENIQDPLELLPNYEGSGGLYETIDGSGAEYDDDQIYEDIEDADENDIDIKGVTKIED